MQIEVLIKGDTADEINRAIAGLYNNLPKKTDGYVINTTDYLTAEDTGQKPGDPPFTSREQVLEAVLRTKIAKEKAAVITEQAPALSKKDKAVVAKIIEACEPIETTTEITVEELRTLLQDKVKGGARIEAKAAVEKFGKNLPSVDKKDYSALKEELEKL